MKRSRAAAICIISAFALDGCTTPEAPWRPHKAFAEAIPLCALLEDLKPYFGRRVLVRGYLTSTPHGRMFLDRGCERGFIPVKTSPETPRARRLRMLFDAYSDQFRRGRPLVPVVYSGVLTDHSPSLTCDQLCEPFSLEAAVLVALRRSNVRDRAEPASRGDD